MSGALQLATIVDWEALADTALAALIGGTVFTLTFSLAIRGTTRAAELRLEDKRGKAFVAGALGGLALIVSLGAVVFGLLVMVA
jgi:hypothetical protein